MLTHSAHTIRTTAPYKKKLERDSFHEKWRKKTRQRIPRKIWADKVFADFDPVEGSTVDFS